MIDHIEEDDEEEYRERRRQRMIAMKREKRRQEMLRRRIRRLSVMAVIAVLLFVLLIKGISSGIKQIRQNIENDKKQQEQELKAKEAELTAAAKAAEEKEEAADEEDTESPAEPGLGVAGGAVPLPTGTNQTIQLGEDIPSAYAVLLDLDNNTIAAQKEAKTVINPASMTKILTVLVAAEHVQNLDDKFTITTDITDFAYTNDCSAVGFEDGEVVTVQDLFYGTILPSGGDAALGLATYVAGSPEAFVDMMNDKIKELGLSNTAHFTNCIGIYDKNHYCTVYDMGIMLEAAMQNEFCRKVLSTHRYTTSETSEHPEGITVSNWFLRRIEDKMEGGTVVAGKTGYVLQSGNCAASYAEGNDGKHYICVTGNAYNGWRCIYDHVEIYKKFMSSSDN